MPSSPPRCCSKSGCPQAATKGGRCNAHQRPAWDGASRPSRHARGYGSDWPARRAAQLRAHPCCQVRTDCQGAPATQVDHHVPLAHGGSHDPSNLRSICDACHRRKTAQDASAGRSARASSRSLRPHPGQPTAPHALKSGDPRGTARGGGRGGQKAGTCEGTGRRPVSRGPAGSCKGGGIPRVRRDRARVSPEDLRLLQVLDGLVAMGGPVDDGALIRAYTRSADPCPITRGRVVPRITRMQRRGLIQRSMAGMIRLTPAGTSIVHPERPVAGQERGEWLARAESEHLLDTAVRGLLRDLEQHPCTCAADPRRCKKENHASAARRKER